MKSACVVGSGPSGALCAYGLVKAGVEVTMLDVGLEIDDHLKDLTGNAATVDPEHFMSRVRAQRRRTANPQAIPAKMPYGSDYAYRTVRGGDLELAAGTKLVHSHALGGLSNAWGANVCGLAPNDVDDWPFAASDLDPYFAELGGVVDVCGSTDDAVNELYERPLEQSETFPLGPQGQYVLSRVNANADELKRRHLYCGRGKLAIGRRYSTNGEGCVSCGLCMHGCPYNAIFCSKDVVAELQREPGFHYLPGRLVRRFDDGDERVAVTFEETASGEVSELAFDRLFIGCGAIGTTALVARSLDLCDHTFSIKDSTKYLFPFVTDRRLVGAMRAPANTLSQLFVQSVRQESTPRTVHGQLYGYNDLILDPLRKVLGDLVLKVAPLGALALERIMIGMVYFHSDDSGTLEFDVSPDGPGLGSIRGVESERSVTVLDEFMAKLTAARAHLGGRPIRMLAQKNEPGLSQHFGSSLPMRREPERHETDVYGRPFGCKRTHCVDSSVLPAIPGTPTAMVLMANALRIAAASRAL